MRASTPSFGGRPKSACGNIAAFFRRLQPFHLSDAPGGAANITTDEGVLNHGKQVFANSCAYCHSSKQPPAGIDPQSGDGKAWFRAAVMQPDFLENNFLSNDKRYPLTKIQTNSGRAFGTNAMTGHIWDNFSSQTYKELPSARRGRTLQSRSTKRSRSSSSRKRNTPGPAITGWLHSLVCGARRPFLHNNALGKFTGDPSVAGRLEAYNDAAEKLLWPEKRLGKASIWRTQNECNLHLRKEFVPKPLQALADNDGYLSSARFPKARRSTCSPTSSPTLATWLRSR